MIIRAYAKINIALKILGKREDGYHEVKSFMQAVPDLYDVIEVIETDETEITCSVPTLSCGPDNLAAKALKLLGKNARVHIEKNIPIAAGLAGGSADAAAVLYAFKGAGYEAYELASKLGSDVPFSLMAIQKYGNCAAIATGTGTELTPCGTIKGKIITLTPNFAISTSEVYREYDKLTYFATKVSEKVANTSEITPTCNVSREFDVSPQHKDACTKAKDACTKALPEDIDPLTFALTYGNDLQAPAINLCPEIQTTLDKLKAPHPIYGEAIKVQQSGSGPTCFAIYKEEGK